MTARIAGPRYRAITVDEADRRSRGGFYTPTRRMPEAIEQKNGPPNWPEAPAGEKGQIITNVRFNGLQRRDLVAGDDTKGGYLSDQGTPVTYIEAVGNRMVLEAMGATISTDPGGPLPVVTSEGQVYHPLEGTPIAASNLEFGVISPVPHWVGISISFSRLFPAVAGPLAERAISEEMARREARAIDGDGIAGSGVNGEPIGVLSAQDIGSADGTTFSVTTLAEMRRILAAAHFLPTAAVGNAATEKLLRTRPKATNGEIMLLGDDNRLGGIPFFVTESMPDGVLLIGDFRELVVVIYTIQINRNPYSKAREGMIEVDQFAAIDTVVRHPGAFCKAVDLT